MIPRASYKKVIQSLGGSANHEPKYNSGKARYIKAPMQKTKSSASKNYSYRFPMYQAAFAKGQGSVIVIDEAPQNSQFALNLIHWSDGVTAYQVITTKAKIK